MKTDKEQEIERLKARLTELTEDSAEATEGYIDALRGMASKAGDSMREGFDTAKEQGKESWDKTSKQIKEYAKENPWHVVAAAAAVGFILAKMTGNGRKD